MTELRFLAAAIAALLVLSPAHAVDLVDQACKKYSDKAMKAINNAEFKKCKVSGAAWNPLWQAHYDWCTGLYKTKGAGQQALEIQNREHSSRQAVLDQCGDSGNNAKQNFDFKENFACLYEEANYKGFSKCIPYVGKMNIKADRAEQYSSARVKNGFRLRVYSERDQEGESCHYDVDTPRFGADCNDMAQSIEIIEK
jgi:hypothetical protein